MKKIPCSKKYPSSNTNADKVSSLQAEDKSACKKPFSIVCDADQSACQQNFPVAQPRCSIDHQKCEPKGYHMLIVGLRNARRSIGLTQQQLADQVGVSLQVIKRLERGIGSVATLVVVMNALAFRMTGRVIVRCGWSPYSHIWMTTIAAEPVRRVSQRRKWYRH